MNRLLNVFAEEMQKLDINYDFMEWKETPIPYPYFVGQYFIDNYEHEKGVTEGQLLLVGWDRNDSFINLVDIDNKVRKHFSEYRRIKDNASININYLLSNSSYSDNDNLKKIEIRLDFSLWEGE